MGRPVCTSDHKYACLVPTRVHSVCQYQSDTKRVFSKNRHIIQCSRTWWYQWTSPFLVLICCLKIIKINTALLIRVCLFYLLDFSLLRYVCKCELWTGKKERKKRGRTYNNNSCSREKWSALLMAMCMEELMHATTLVNAPKSAEEKAEIH